MSPRSAVVHVVDDDDAFRTAVSRLLKAAGYETKGYRSAGDFLLDPPVAGPGCILLDLRMPGPSGIELQKAIAKTGLGFPVIFLTGRGDVRQSVLAMRQGAVDFLTKPVQRKELLAAVEEALKRQSTEGADAGRRSEVARRFETLTVREREVFELVVVGRLNKQIGAAMGVSERTVKAHRAQVMDKMQSSSVAELVHAAGLLRRRSVSPLPLAGPEQENPAG